MSSTLTFPSITLLKNIVDPIDAQDAATKHYIDLSLSSGGANIGAAGNITEIQFNNAGTLGASANLTFDGNLMTIIGNISSRNATLGNLVTANYITINNNANIVGNLISGNANLGNLATANYLSIANDVDILGTLSAGDTTITGNLTVTGTTTSVNSTVTQIVDPIFELGGGANGAALTANDNKERGTLMHYYRDTAPVDAFMGWMNANSEFAFGSNVTVADNNITINTLGNIRAGNASLGNLVTANYVNVTANLTSGNASLGNLATANYVNVTANISAGNADLGNLATANYVTVAANISAGNADLGNLVTANYLTINNGVSIPEMTADQIIGRRENVDISANTTIDTFTASKYRAAKYIIKASNNLGYQVVEAIIVHDGVDSYATVYGSISTASSDIIEIDTFVVGSSIELKATAVTPAVNTKIRLLGTYIAD